MKSKVKKRCKQMLTGLLALSMLCGLLPQNSVSVSAATTAKTNVSSYGRLGNVDVGSKTKTEHGGKSMLAVRLHFVSVLERRVIPEILIR